MLWAGDCARRKNSRGKRKPGQRRSLISRVFSSLGFGLFIRVVGWRRIRFQGWAGPHSFQDTQVFNYSIPIRCTVRQTLYCKCIYTWAQTLPAVINRNTFCLRHHEQPFILLLLLSDRSTTCIFPYKSHQRTVIRWRQL